MDTKHLCLWRFGGQTLSIQRTLYANYVSRHPCVFYLVWYLTAVLCVVCGDAPFLRALSPTSHVAQLVGFDYDMCRIRVAKALSTHSNIQYRHADLSRLGDVLATHGHLCGRLRHVVANPPFSMWQAALLLGTALIDHERGATISLLALTSTGSTSTWRAATRRLRSARVYLVDQYHLGQLRFQHDHRPKLSHHVTFYVFKRQPAVTPLLAPTPRSHTISFRARAMHLLTESTSMW